MVHLSLLWICASYAQVGTWIGDGPVDGLVPDSNGPGDTWTELQAGSSIAAASHPEMNIPDIERLEALRLRTWLPWL